MPTETEEKPINSIYDALNVAMGQVQEEVKPEEETEIKKEEKKEDEKEPEKETEEKETEVKKEEDVDLLSAININKILKDPVQALKFGQYLVSTLSSDEQKTAKDTKDEAQEIIDKLEKAVGEDHVHLLEPVVKIFNELISRRDKAYDERIGRIDHERLVEKIQIQTSNFIEKNAITPKETQAMFELSKEMPRGDTVPVDRYLGNLLKIVRPEKQIEVKKEEKKNDKIRENLKEHQKESKLDKDIKRIPRSKTEEFKPRDAVMMALNGLKFEDDE